MNKLFKFKDWLTIPDAAKQLSFLLESEEVTEADILELGLNKHLKLSVHIPHAAYVRRGKRLPLSEANKINYTAFHEMISRPGDWDMSSAIENTLEPIEWIYPGIRTGEDEVIQFEDEIERISGTWDLLMWGGERLHVEKLFYALKSETYLDLCNIDGSFVQTYDEKVVFSLQEYLTDFSDYKKEDLITPRNHPNNYCPMDGLPQDSFLCVRTEALREFEEKVESSDSVGEPDKDTDKRLASKTENSYLRLLKALSEYATDGLTGKPSTDANAVEAALKSKDISCPVGSKTLASYLEKAQKLPS